MPEDYTKRIDVQFLHGLPLGHRAIFRHNKQIYMAFTLRKSRAMQHFPQQVAGRIALAHRHLTWLVSTDPALYPRLRTALVALAGVALIPPWVHDKDIDNKPEKLEQGKETRNA